MEINISHIMKDLEPHYYSASIAELGPDAAKITWDNAMDRVEKDPILRTVAQVDAAASYFGEFGAWTPKEIDSWTIQELNACLLQDISAKVRQEDDGRNIYRGDDGEFYFYLGV